MHVKPFIADCDMYGKNILIFVCGSLSLNTLRYVELSVDSILPYLTYWMIAQAWTILRPLKTINLTRWRQRNRAMIIFVAGM